MFIIIVTFSSCNGGQSSSGDSSGSSSKPISSSNLIISELMYPNYFLIADEYGDYCPWVELFNPTEKSIKLSDYSIVQDDYSWTLPEYTIAPHEYYLIYMNGKNNGSNCGFTLSSQGKLVLSLHNKICFELEYSNLKNGCSFLTVTGDEFSQPTPGYELPKEADSLIISELMAANDSFPVDNALCDWFELLNTGETDIYLGDYYASDSKENAYMMQLPKTTLSAGEYICIPCDDEDGLRLSKTGDTLYITRKDGVVASFMDFGEVPSDKSYTYDRGVYDFPSPGYENTYQGMCDYINSRSGLLINEVLSSNDSVFSTNGRYYDIIELINSSDKEILLSDYCISDKKSDPFLYTLPEVTLLPGEVYVLVASGRGGRELNFKISSQGERISLTRADGHISDILIIPRLRTDMSWGRSMDSLMYFPSPTIGEPNGNGYINISASPQASRASGVYNTPIGTTLTANGKIYYTLDGSKPDSNSTEYNGETIIISESTSIRAVSYEPDGLPSDDVTFTYLITQTDHELPILCITTEEGNLFGSSGIYDNYSKKWEVEANATLIEEGKEGFSISCGLRIFGAGSRELEKKSFQLKFRASYGGELEYDLFGSDVTSFNSLVVRCGEDYLRAMFRDELQTWAADNAGMELLTQDYKPCVLYLNGEYWGIYFIKERIDENFISSHTGDSTSDIVLISGGGSPEHGSLSSYFALTKYIAEHNLKVEEYYRYVEERINFNSLIDWMIAEMYFGNQDLGNVRYYKGSDGKWNYILYDMDWGMLCSSSLYTQHYNSGVSNFMESDSKGEYLNLIINSLMKNDEFKKLFLTRVNLHMTSSFTNEILLAKIDELSSLLNNEMPRERSRWNGSYERWLSHVEQLRNFVTDMGKGSRADSIIKQVISYFEPDASTVSEIFGSKYLSR